MSVNYKFCLLTQRQKPTLLSVFNVVAPPSIALESTTPNSVVVKMEAPEDEPWIERYEVSIKGGTGMQRCIVRGYVIPLQCQITHLVPYTSYAVEVRSCVPADNACSSAAETSFSTLIQRTRILVLLNEEINNSVVFIAKMLPFYSPCWFGNGKRFTLDNECGNTGIHKKHQRHAL